MQGELEIDVHPDGDRTVLNLAGDVCTTTVGHFEEIITHSLRRRPLVIQLDLRAAFLDSAGVVALLNVCRQCQRHEATVELLSPPALRDVLTRLGLPTRFRVEHHTTIRVITANSCTVPMTPRLSLGTRKVAARDRGSSGRSPSPALGRINLVLRATIELAIVAGLIFWGVQTGGTIGAKLLLGLGAPLIGFGIWSLVDFSWAGHLSELLRRVEELIISGVAAGAWYSAGQQKIGWALVLLAITYHALLYASGARLVAPKRT